MASKLVVSLGDDCTAAYQLRRFTGQSESGIFDWLITPGAALERQIATDFSDFFRRENLQIREKGDGVVDVSNGIIFHHAFSRDAEGAVTPERLDAEYDTVRDKYRHLIGKWRALHDIETLFFVRSTRGNDTSARRVLDLLVQRFPQSAVSLLFYRRGVPDRMHVAPPIVTCDVVEDAGIAPDFWHGNDATWDRAMEALIGLPAPREKVISGVFD